MKWIVKMNCKYPSYSWPLINSCGERADVTVSRTIFPTGLIFMLVHSSQLCQSCQTPPCFLKTDLTTSTSWFSIMNVYLSLVRLLCRWCPKYSSLRKLWGKFNNGNLIIFRSLICIKINCGSNKKDYSNSLQVLHLISLHYVYMTHA